MLKNIDIENVKSITYSFDDEDFELSMSDGVLSLKKLYKKKNDFKGDIKDEFFRMLNGTPCKEKTITEKQNYKNAFRDKIKEIIDRAEKIEKKQKAKEWKSTLTKLPKNEENVKKELKDLYDNSFKECEKEKLTESKN